MRIYLEVVWYLVGTPLCTCTYILSLCGSYYRTRSSDYIGAESLNWRDPVPEHPTVKPVVSTAHQECVDFLHKGRLSTCTTYLFVHSSLRYGSFVLNCKLHIIIWLAWWSGFGDGGCSFVCLFLSATPSCNILLAGVF